MLAIATPCVKNGKPTTRTLEIDWIDNGFDLPSLVIEEGKRIDVYAVEEFDAAADFNGRAFNLVKSDGSESYPVLVSRDPRQHQCHCAGWCYGRGKPCKHLAAMCRLVQDKIV